jgi:hypothetical protein
MSVRQRTHYALLIKHGIWPVAQRAIRLDRKSSQVLRTAHQGGLQSPIVQLCGVRTETCPPGMKTGDQISPPGGHVGGGLQMQTDLAIGPAGDAWVMNNWQLLDTCFPGAQETLSTLCGGQGVTVFFGMAKPVRAPQIGPARQP